MPLSQDDPKLDYDGSWADASKGWPSISFPTEEEAKAAYVVAWQDAKVPYGSYVLVGKELRLEKLELKKLVELHLQDPNKGAEPMIEPRWHVGRKLGRTLYREGRFVGVVDTPELAAEIVATMNGAAPNDRLGIAAALSREANRIFHEQEKDYPSNVLDTVAWNLRAGEDELLTVKNHPSGRGIGIPDPKDCPACAKVARHPGQGYVCAWHPNVKVD